MGKWLLIFFGSDGSILMRRFNEFWDCAYDVYDNPPANFIIERVLIIESEIWENSLKYFSEAFTKWKV